MPTIEISISQQSLFLLQEIAKCGIYGQDVDEVAARMIDQFLAHFVEPPQFESPLAAIANLNPWPRHTGDQSPLPRDQQGVTSADLDERTTSK